MLPKTYDPGPVEDKWSEIWQKEKLFISAADKGRKPFVIVIPPPNITGALHMGHALNNILQDSLVRYERMTGKEAYWVPGTDHGGIATQNVMEKMLKTEGRTKEDLGREKFLERMWAWYWVCGDTILNQLRKLGCALDTGKANVRFTMDAKRATAVFEAFSALWKKGLIYRGERMINWCTRCGTALSDIEVEYEEEKSKLWHIHYPAADGSKGLTVATTRPETMLGDTAVAVNPEDDRYKTLIGGKLKLPLAGRVIPVIAESVVDKTFGTGAVKVTPAHDPADFEIGRRHGLQFIRVIDFTGRMVNCPEKYRGKNAQAARKEIVEDLKAGEFLEKEEHYRHSVNKCERCHQHIEPLVSEQWFVKMKDLAAPAIKAAESEEVKFYPSSWKKPFIEWLKNIQDWCISRQIWWGHRIPVWYCKTCSSAALRFSAAGELSRVSFKGGAKPAVSFAKPPKCPDCGGADFVQDPDVLDTWFSSALWPFSVFGWPQRSEELAYYYPTSVLVTGYEILYLWVARMVMSGIEHMGRPPFSYVYVHGIIRDRHGKKMSKSLGNGIDPLSMTDKYGTDAMRFAILSQAAGGKDIPFSEEALIGGRNFVNKIYNVFRFIMMNLPENSGITSLDEKQLKALKASGALTLADDWILERYGGALDDVKACMADYDIGNAVSVLYRFFWDDFCDWYLELAKPRLETADKAVTLGILLHLFGGTLKALHPFMPYVTEELFSGLKAYTSPDKPFLLKEKYPFSLSAGGGPAGLFGGQPSAFSLQSSQAESSMKKIMGVVTQIRTLRAEFEIPPARTVKTLITSADKNALELLKKHESYISRLARTEGLEIAPDLARPARAASALSDAFNIYVPLEGMIDLEKEKARIAKEAGRLGSDLALCEGKLKSPNFISRAAKAEVDRVVSRKADAENKLARLETILRELA
ncbi:MAG: valine--tRNA ligase [Elusimicrobia bacterium]|nr:valine--tRNA ligase [Elusimicrobiota bacterium]